MDGIRNLIAKFSLVFIKNFRITVILFLATIFLGYFSYTSFLKREGFPSIQVPVATINSTYFVNDKNKVNTDVTEKIENSIAKIPEVKQIQSTTTENGIFIMAEFEEEFDIKQGPKLLREEVERGAELPENANTEYKSFNAGSMDGKHDFLFTLSKKGESTEKLQEKAAALAKQISKADEVLEAEAIDLITTERNPVTGGEFKDKSAFNHIGYKKDGQLIFEDAVTIGVVKKNGTGTFEISDAVKEEVDVFKKDGKLDGYNVNYSLDPADPLALMIKQLERAGLDGLIAVAIVLLLLISFRASLVAAIFVPINLGATLIALYLMGYNLNTIVLFALILLIALLVDDAIVVIEAIDREKKNGKKNIDAVATAIRNIGIADISGTITTILVFLPMAFISGVLGDFIVYIPITIISGLILSIIIALTILPYITNIIISDKTHKKDSKIDRFRTKVEGGVTGFLEKFIGWYLKKPLRVLGIIILTIGIVILGTSFASKLKFSIFPSPKDSERLIFQMTFDDGTTIEKAEETSKQIEKIITAEAGENLKGISYVEAGKTGAVGTVDLIPMKEREITSKEVSEKLESKFKDLKGVDILVGPEGAGPPTSEFQFFVQVTSEDQTKLEKATAEIKNFLEGKEILDGEKVEKVRVDNLTVIAKKDKERYAEVKAKVSDKENSGLIVELEKIVKAEFDEERLKSLGLAKESLAFDQGQETENANSFKSAGIALVVSLIIIYIILIMQFNSFIQPTLILLAIPLSFAGLFPGLYYTNNPLSFFVMLGVISLAGLVINNTILLTDYANSARERGESIADSIIGAIKVRMRPLVATSLTTVAGLVPLALTDPFWESISYSIIFGLLASTFLVLIAYPAFYLVFEKVKSFKIIKRNS